ncbi:potassium transporter Kef [Leptospira perolatii]|uniref:Potassium transporter Kef n=1 Tax=Leptospira perolatii TaxID=2023191 RepID=A0A2M9ZKU8_9LEPT|nr:cation:proton antiporter [Leptospira perolatii]PJZ69988.1 potassium transporter Kef [Leptospira perolatii]PJZ72604.1 potassium transporter Kef [Leptospira perolatii]
MEHHSFSLLTDIALSIIFATIFSHIAKILKQPLILGYVIGGLFLGPSLGMGWVQNEESIELISEIGLILLLFIIGLEIDLKELARMGRSMFLLGVIQFFFSVGLAWFAFRNWFSSAGNFDLLYFSIALALSSTMIVVKLLHDKFEISTIAGRLTIGVLVLQDIWAILFMGIQPDLQDPKILNVLGSLGKGLALVGFAFLISRYALSRLFLSAASKPELILITSIAWCFFLCGVAEKLELSKEMGALIAGISIAAFPYGADVISKLGGIRDFFITLFFVALGMKIPKPGLESLGFSMIAVLFVIVTRILTVAPTVFFSGKGLRAGIIAGLNLAQISEFSLVILALGVQKGHISHGLQANVLTSMILASIASTYIILFNDKIARGILWFLNLFGLRERKEPTESESTGTNKRDIVILGYFRIAQGLIEGIERTNPSWLKRILVVDYNPVYRLSLEAKGIRWAYGDLANPESLHHLGIEEAKYIVCTISDMILKGTTNRRLFESLKQICKHNQPDYVLTTDDIEEAELLKKNGAAHVVIPGRLSGFSLLEELKGMIQDGKTAPTSSKPRPKKSIKSNVKKGSKTKGSQKSK